MQEQTFKIIAKIHTDFPEKFGIPRQSGLVKGAKGVIKFEPEYRSVEAFRGLEGYSHIWVLWGFSEAKRETWAATVTPPRLGGKKRMGVFATRSPFRPNPIGMSVVKLEEIIFDENKGPLLRVSGVDMLDGTPVYDIKPYLPYADSYPDAKDGFAGEVYDHALQVEFPEEMLDRIPKDYRESLVEILRQDPRAAFIEDDSRIWGVTYGKWNVRFTVVGDVLTVCEVETVDKEVCKG
ncbi:MAG: tRNA (N6-threonylcarbamoyladenosine(37)-N6)-methyltransferase TrmO [Lachnospiraceae bacterium]|nr:tRNA (N6-threonylcarbamoyladenosine(37)-N6)-methyltransferase TrmO [Lachnospiraceae bacterium]